MIDTLYHSMHSSLETKRNKRSGGVTIKNRPRLFSQRFFTKDARQSFQHSRAPRGFSTSVATCRSLSSVTDCTEDVQNCVLLYCSTHKKGGGDGEMISPVHTSLCAKEFHQQTVSDLADLQSLAKNVFDDGTVVGSSCIVGTQM